MSPSQKGTFSRYLNDLLKVIHSPLTLRYCGASGSFLHIPSPACCVFLPPQDSRPQVAWLVSFLYTDQAEGTECFGVGGLPRGTQTLPVP